jgi:peptidyl-prolyl cis-trans isomerase SurA
MEQLESDVFLEIDRLKPGEISKPIEFIDKQGIQVQKAYKLIYLIRRYAPHEATLEQDYQKFHGAALTAKQNEILEGWLKKVRGEVYIELRDEACSQALTNWVRP